MNGQSAMGIIIFVFLVIVYQLVDKVYGNVGGIRYWGLVLCMYSIATVAMKELPIKIGQKQLSTLTGFKKAFISVPAFLLGAYIAIFPNEFACVVALKGYVCRNM